MTQTHRPGIEYTPPRPAVVAVAGREIAVEEWPLATAVEETRDVEIRSDSGDVLVIGPRRGATARRTWFAVTAILGALVPLIALAIAEELPAWLLATLAAGLLALAAAVVRGGL